MQATSHLALINLFVGDIQGGLGPFLGTWLAQAAQWSPSQVGLVTTLVGLATLALSGPLGALVDRVGRPRLLIAAACGAILAGTLLLMGARSFPAVLAAQFVAALGGTLVVPAVTALTLGIVGKQAFPRQQGRNQAWNHVGILGAALVIGFGTPYVGPVVAFWVLGLLAAAAIVAALMTPKTSWNARRAVGWKEDDPEDRPERSAILRVLADRRLLLLSAALALFNLSNGSMLSLLGQKLVAAGQDGTGWTARYVMVAQLVMIPVALLAGSLADRRGRRQLLLVACAVLPVRALLSAFLDDPAWLILAQVLDGVASGVIGVAVPVVVADLTWGSGRTQTALGTVAAVQGVGGALSGWVGGLLAIHLGWTWAFVALALPAAAALGLALWLEETCAPGGRDGAGAPCSAAEPPVQAPGQKAGQEPAFSR
ncbi:MFS transporter [Methylobacterium isbiliense]|jgi:MFS family permease|uniref:MFS-type transporter n=1 Tax=Methylobacterium isbiliense TaxID=315478 RepID=A0ABQ4S8C3_9HYPH|nr:MFS transporter [Methylobacterium isbiliense]MDN3623489.1 MFS transporter [Methylobacterium isbiliense]GJD99211.1 putative MFS-type transporter [Methylobacterium isbiliense]